MSTRKIEVEILEGRKLIAFATSDPNYPRIDVYLDHNGELLELASVEDNQEHGLRLVSYSNLSSDEAVSVQNIV